ncbi:Ryanodine receptor-like 2, partial [Homarus americanus]
MAEAEVQPSAAAAEPPPVAQDSSAPSPEPVPPSSPHTLPTTPSTSVTSPHHSPPLFSSPSRPGPPHQPTSIFLSRSTHPTIPEDSIFSTCTIDATIDTSTSTGIFSSSTSPGDETIGVRKSVTLPSLRHDPARGVTHSLSHQSSLQHHHTQQHSSLISSPLSSHLSSSLSLSSKSIPFTSVPTTTETDKHRSLQHTPTKPKAASRTRHSTSPSSVPSLSSPPSGLETTFKSTPTSLCQATLVSIVAAAESSGDALQQTTPLSSPSALQPSSTVSDESLHSRLVCSQRASSPTQITHSQSAPGVSLGHLSDPSPPPSSHSFTVLTTSDQSLTTSIQLRETSPTCTLRRRVISQVDQEAHASSSLPLPSSQASTSQLVSFSSEPPLSDTVDTENEHILTISLPETLQATDPQLTALRVTSPESLLVESSLLHPFQSSLAEHSLYGHSLLHPDPSLLHPSHIDPSQLTPSPPSPTQPHPSDATPARPPTPTFPAGTYTPPSSGVLQRIVNLMVDLSSYNKRIVSFLARNFYNLKYAALVLAFCINFILLFFKASALAGEEEEEEEVVVHNPFAFGSGDLLGSGDGAVLGDDAEELGSGNFTLGEDDGDDDDEDEDE